MLTGQIRRIETFQKIALKYINRRSILTIQEEANSSILLLQGEAVDVARSEIQSFSYQLFLDQHAPQPLSQRFQRNMILIYLDLIAGRTKVAGAHLEIQRSQRDR